MDDPSGQYVGNIDFNNIPETRLDPTLATYDFLKDNLLGEKGYGHVYKGKLQDRQLITAKENFNILVYEYICNKFLYWHLFEKLEEKPEEKPKEKQEEKFEEKPKKKPEEKSNEDTKKDGDTKINNGETNTKDRGIKPDDGESNAAGQGDSEDNSIEKKPGTNETETKLGKNTGEGEDGETRNDKIDEKVDLKANKSVDGQANNQSSGELLPSGAQLELLNETTTQTLRVVRGQLKQ
nr:probable methyltransferase PMT26 [Populus alba]